MTARHLSDDTTGSIGARLAGAVEHEQRLDGAVAALTGPAQRLTATPRRRRVLLGYPMGHALHPLLTDLPIGCWTSSWLLDLFPVDGPRRASRRLIALGVVTAAPTAWTGWAEWSRTTEPEVRRVGVVHAAANAGAVLLYTGSWLARRTGHHRTGVALGQVGALAATAGGFLGGHLAIGREVGSTATN